VTAPVRAQVSERLKSVRNAVFELHLITSRQIAGLADAFGHDLLSALFVTSVIAVLTLTSSSVQQEFTAQSTADDLVELSWNKFMSVHDRHFFWALAHSTMTT